MEKIRIILADSDGLYLDKLTNYFIEKTSMFEVYSFTSKESLIRFTKDGENKIDIVLSTEAFIDDIKDNVNIPVKILLSNNSYDDTEIANINKYQKAEKMIKDILILYAEKTGRMGAILSNKKSTNVIGVYSPVGGCGKTTISLALSRYLASIGKRVFYLNYEIINSTSEFLNCSPKGSFSEVLLSLKTKGANVALQIISNEYKDENLKISYINPSESALELNEITTQEKVALIRQLDTMGEFDSIIIDFDNDFTAEKQELLEACDLILMPFTTDSASLRKMRLLLREAKMRHELDSLFSKVHFAVNKVQNITKFNINDLNIGGLKSSDVIIPLSTVFSDVNNMFYAAETIGDFFRDFVNSVTEAKK